MPEIEIIFSIITEVAHTTGFTIEKFKDIYNQYVSRGELKETNFDYVLTTLFDFSVIGNLPNPNYPVFRFKNKEAKLNKKERITLNRGLFKSLQVI